MKFHIKHEISWQYDRPVFVEPMTVLLRPRCDGSLNLLSWQLTFAPHPGGTCSSLDTFGNSGSLVWFNEQHEILSVSAVSTVETTRPNPFDYLLIGRNSEKLPLIYDDPLGRWLSLYRQRPTADDRIDSWATNLAKSSGDTQAFLSTLTTTLSTEFEWITREDGPAIAPAETLESRRGACRDLAVLFIDACRSVGIASRFVSGYAFEPDREEPNDLHAWAEVYLPGAGWRGYDPTLGLAVADHHVPVAAAPEPDAAAPTTGAFRGTDAQSTMEYRVEIQSLTDQ